MRPPPEPEALLGNTHWLRALALQVVGDAHAAEDVLQETWLAVLRRPPFEAHADVNLRAWLARVTRNIALRTLRSSARRRARELGGARPECSEADGGSVADSLDRAFWQRELMEAVMRLDEPQREVVVLRYLEGLQPHEIARKLDISGTAVRSRLHRGLTSLRTQLDRKHGDVTDWSPALILLATPTAPGGPLLGALLMKTQAKIAMALALIASVVGVGLLLESDAKESVSGLEREHTELVEPEAEPLAVAARPPVERRQVESPAERLSAASAAAPTTGPVVEIEGVVSDTEERPVAGIQVVLESDPQEAEQFSIVDGDDVTLRYTIQYGKTADGFYTSVSGGGTIDLTDGKSEVVQVDDTARAIVLYSDGVEVRRVQLELDPDELKLIRL